jgi:hypothetical protein
MLADTFRCERVERDPGCFQLVIVAANAILIDELLLCGRYADTPSGH